VSRMSNRLLIFLLLALPLTSIACEKGESIDQPGEPVKSQWARTVFNRITKQSSEVDAALMKRYGCKYIFANVADTSALTRPKPVKGSLPATPADAQGNRIVGRVLVGYVVSIDGLVMDPVVLESTDPRLTKVALESMKAWQFTPATFNGMTVATLAAQEFNFNVSGADT
jgi:TonB family protein